MKSLFLTIIAITLLFSCTQQSKVTEKQDYQLKIDTIYTYQVNSQTALDLNELLDVYFEQCYNDSVRAPLDIFIINGDTTVSRPVSNPQQREGYYGREIFWIHKTPSFVDFKLWLNKNIQQ